MTATPGQSHHSMQEKLCQCSMMPRHFGSLPLSSDKQTMDPTWLKSLAEEDTDEPGITFASGTPKLSPWGRTCPSPGKVAPTTPEWPGAPPVQKPLTVQKSPLVLKSPPVQKVPVAPTTTTSPSTGAPQQTGAAPAAPHRSACTHKPPTRLIIEMWPHHEWCWPRLPLDHTTLIDNIYIVIMLIPALSLLLPK